jgi:hypothetical protein
MASVIFVKIDRATGNVVKRKKYDTDNPRPLNKSFVWLEEVQEAKPVYDEDIDKLVPVITLPDLSDLNADVDPLLKWVRGYNVVALNAQELQARVDVKVAVTDGKLVKAVELIFTKIATNGGVALQRSDFPNLVWDKINARRALRGEAPV